MLIFGILPLGKVTLLSLFPTTHRLTNMENQLNPFEQKFLSLFTYAEMALVEFEQSGKIVLMNIVAEKLLQPIIAANNLAGDNIYDILDCFDHTMSVKIKNYSEPGGNIINNLLTDFVLPIPGDIVKRHLQFSIGKMFDDCLLLALDDLTAKHLEEKAMQQADLEKAVALGKFEIASEVLHDIGNAVVGFGSYLSRIKRSMEHNNIENLQNVITFLQNNHTEIGKAIGQQKADALENLLSGIVKSQKESNEDINKSITEQLNIISHIQEILTIQRQYITSYGSQERKQVNIKDVIHDCRSMLFATYDKKGISVSFNVQEALVLIKGDRTKLMQVILNILKNSIEAIDMDAPQKQIEIKLFSDNEKVQLSIQDTGKGFESELSKNFFERGYTTKNTGTGLGLYNCKSIIESHAGTITIESKGPDLGAITTIIFPLEKGIN